jgi:hypothetical protein
MTRTIYGAFHGSTGLASAVFSDAYGLYFFPQIGDRESKELAAADDAIVVWDPNYQEFRAKQPGLVKTIETYYAPEARFGLIEVWRRTKGSGAVLGTSVGRGPTFRGMR